MKQAIAAFFRFSRTERLGIAALGIMAMLYVLFKMALPHWVHPAGNEAENARLAAAYTAWKLREDSVLHIAQGAETAPEAAAGPMFAFDPNTLDSAGFIRLGMPAKAVKGLMSWRRKGKHFYKAEDLKPLYNLPAECYARLEPYVRIAGDEERPAFEKSFRSSYPALPAVIELNTADSALLDRGVNGIGAVLAHKIVARRMALGGFLRHEQLLEIYKFPDTTFRKLKEKLHIDAGAVRRMNLNTATLAQLSAHPYIGEKTAKNILLYREGIKRYDHIEQLREAPLMTEEIYRKIAPYLSVE